MEGQDQLVLGMLWYVVFVASATLHEAAHAFSSWKFGDPTAYHAGQVSLNPMNHIKREPFGMVVIPWISFAAMGWMVGWASAPYDPAWAAVNPTRSALKTLAGPAANLALVILAGLLIHAGLLTGLFVSPDQLGFSQVVQANANGLPQALAILVSIIFSLNLVLFVFNMIPLPPLDGQSWMTLLLRGELRFHYQRLTTHHSMRFLGIFLAWMLMRIIFWPIYLLALKSIYIFYGVSYG